MQSVARDNTARYRLFEGNKKKPELTEDQKVLVRKRQELARVRVRGPLQRRPIPRPQST